MKIIQPYIQRQHCSHNLELKDANGYQDHEDSKLKVEGDRL